MFIALGIVAGLLGFAPVAVSMRLARRSTSAEALTFGLYGLSGVFVSLILLAAAMIIVAVVSRPDVVSFAVPEVITFLVATIVYVLYKNVLAKKRKRVE